MYHRPVTATAFRVPPAYPDVALPEEGEVDVEDVNRLLLLAPAPELTRPLYAYSLSTSSDATLPGLRFWLEGVSDTFVRKAAITLETTLNDLVSNSVLIPCRAEVRQYLREHRDMIALVDTVSKSAAQRFCRSGQVSLETYKDPEFEDEYLTLYVRQEEYDQTVLDAIDDLRTTCSGELAERSGWLLVTTDFQPPR